MGTHPPTHSKDLHDCPHRLGIAYASYNEEIVSTLLDTCLGELRTRLAQGNEPTVVQVPGALELPQALRMFICHGKPDVLIALGCVLRGETTHYDIVSVVAAQALERIAEQGRLPVINGIICCENLAQARARASKGAEFARSALVMAQLATQDEKFSL